MNLSNIKPLLYKINDVSKKENCPIYLVGGLVRDLLLQKELESRGRIDIDFALKNDIKKFTEEVAAILDSKVIVLDKRFTTFRIVLKEDDKVYYQLDFSSLKGNNINEDLKNRDFTINAFAIELSEFLNLKKIPDLYNKVIFPPGAKESLEQGKIIPVSSSGFNEDPLRLIRAFSIGAYLSFNIPEEILENITSQRKLLKNISLERIRDEIFRLFSVNNSYKYIVLMAKSKVLDEIFPELIDCRGVDQGPYHCRDIYWHSIESIKKFEKFLPQILKDGYLKPRLKKYLNQYIVDNRKRKELLKLALLLHDVGKPEAKQVEKNKIKFWGHENIGRKIVSNISERLKLSNLEKRDLKGIIYYHLRPGNLVEEKNPTKKAIHRFFRHAEKNTPAVILLSVADKYATAGKLVSEASMDNHKDFLIKLLKKYFRLQEKVIPKKLINGNDVMEILNLEPSPKVGEVLEEVKLLQMQGTLKNREDALQYLRRLKEN